MVNLCSDAMCMCHSASGHNADDRKGFLLQARGSLLAQESASTQKAFSMPRPCGAPGLP